MQDKTARHSGGHVVAVVCDGFSPLELGVASDVFGADRSDTLGVEWYSFSLCSLTSDGHVRSDVGFHLVVDYGLERISSADTVVVLPTERPGSVPLDMLAALRSAAKRGARMVSLCTGAFALAAAGVLDGRRATTHWAECDELARRHPRVSVDPAVLFVDEGQVLTSAGSAASIDLCLHIVRNDFGSEIATQVARDLVVPMQRDGGQAQFIEMPLLGREEALLFGETLAWLEENLDRTVSVEELAARSAMSPRTFARRFLATTGTTPYQWLTRQRVRQAQRFLEATDLTVDAVADRSGFGTADNLRKHFGRTLHTSPLAYRRAFQDKRAS